MTTRNIFYLIALLAITMLSCNKSDDLFNGDGNNTDKAEPIQFLSLITRATETNFEANDEIGVFAMETTDKDSIGVVDSVNYADNVKYVYRENGRFTAASTAIKADIEGAELVFHAVYPYSADTKAQYKFTVTDNYEASDLMTARSTPSTENLISLKFNHRLAKLVIDYKTEGWPAGDMLLTLKGVKTVANVDLNVLTFDADDDVTGDIKATSNGTNSFKIVLPPQAIPSSEEVFYVTIGDEEYPVVINRDVWLKSGVQTVMTMEYNDKTASLEFVGDINEWESPVGYPTSSYKLSDDKDTLIYWNGPERDVDMTTDAVLKNVKVLGDYAFKSHYLDIEGSKVWTSVLVEKLIVAQGVTYIGSGCFRGTLSSIQLPPALTSMGTYVFSECHRLQSVVFPDGLKEIPDHTFFKNKGIKTVVLGDNVTHIHGAAFYASSLKDINFPNTLRHIGLSAFSFTNVETVDLKEGLLTMASSFDECEYLKTVSIPSTLEDLASGGFSGCINLRSVVIKPGIQSIGSFTFKGCTLLEEIIIPEGVRSIGSHSFEGCTSMKKISLPSTHKSFGSLAPHSRAYAAWGTTGIFDLSSDNQWFDIDDNKMVMFYKHKRTLIGASASLENYTTPAQTTNIRFEAFRDCFNLETLVISEGCRAVGRNIVQRCNKLTSIDFPSTITQFYYPLSTIADHENLKTITCRIMDPTNPKLEINWGSGITQCTLRVPKGTLALYKEVKAFDKFKEIVEFE